MDSIDVWQCMCYELGEENLVLWELLPDADVAFTSGICRKWPYAWVVAVVLYILEFTSPNNWPNDWQIQTDAYKTERYTLLLDTTATLLPQCKVVIVSLGISSQGLKWQTDLSRFKVQDKLMNKLVRELVDRCLTALSDTQKISASALRH